MTVTTAAERLHLGSEECLLLTCLLKAGRSVALSELDNMLATALRVSDHKSAGLASKYLNEPVADAFVSRFGGRCDLTPVGETSATQIAAVYQTIHDAVAAMAPKAAPEGRFVKVPACAAFLSPPAISASAKGQFLQHHSLFNRASAFVAEPYWLEANGNDDVTAYTMRFVDAVARNTAEDRGLIANYAGRLNAHEWSLVREQLWAYIAICKDLGLAHGDLGNGKNILLERTPDSIRIQLHDPSVTAVPLGDRVLMIHNEHLVIPVDPSTGNISTSSAGAVSQFDVFDLSVVARDAR